MSFYISSTQSFFSSSLQTSRLDFLLLINSFERREVVGIFNHLNEILLTGGADDVFVRRGKNLLELLFASVAEEILG
jgi:hypothetical protein